MTESRTRYAALDAILDSPITSAERLVMVALLVRAGIREDGVAYPSLANLGRQAGATSRHVRRLLRNIESSGLIVSEPCKGRPTRYRIVWPRLMPDPGHPCPPLADVTPTKLPERYSRGCPATTDTSVPSGRTPASDLPGHLSPPNHSRNKSKNTTIEQSPDGVFQNADETNTKPQEPFPTCWPNNITAATLNSISQLRDLWECALADGIVGDSDRLQFLTLACYCRRRELEKAIDSAGAVFTALVRQRKWFGDVTDEERARIAEREIQAAMLAENLTPNAQPPPTDSSDRAQKRTQRS